MTDDFALTTSTSPEGWDWRMLDTSRPRRALEHITHSEITPVIVDSLGPGDRSQDVDSGQEVASSPRSQPPVTQWTVTRDIPILVVDSLDAYWAFERVLNKLHGFGRTKEDAKSDLAARLGSHFQLLSSLESPRMAPILRLELEFLRAVMRPVGAPGQ